MLSVQAFGPLLLEGLKLDGDPDFALQPAAEGRLQPGEAQQFNVFFEPQIGGPRGADLIFESNDPDEGDGVVAVSGAGRDTQTVTEDHAQDSTGSQTVFPLTKTPLDVGTLEVKVNTTIVPTSYWSYQAGSNAIAFDGNQAPPANSTVHVTFLAAVTTCE